MADSQTELRLLYCQTQLKSDSSSEDVLYVLDPDLLKLLICPETSQSLAMADEKIVTALNLGIQQGKIKNVGGMTLTRPLDGGLIREDNVVLYPVIDGIPALLNDEAIKLEEINA